MNDTKAILAITRCYPGVSVEIIERTRLDPSGAAQKVANVEILTPGGPVRFSSVEDACGAFALAAHLSTIVQGVVGVEPLNPTSEPLDDFDTSGDEPPEDEEEEPEPEPVQVVQRPVQQTAPGSVHSQFAARQAASGRESKDNKPIAPLGHPTLV